MRDKKRFLSFEKHLVSSGRSWWPLCLFSPFFCSAPLCNFFFSSCLDFTGRTCFPLIRTSIFVALVPTCSTRLPSLWDYHASGLDSLLDRFVTFAVYYLKNDTKLHDRRAGHLWPQLRNKSPNEDFRCASLLLQLFVSTPSFQHTRKSLAIYFFKEQNSRTKFLVTSFSFPTFGISALFAFSYLAQSLKDPAPFISSHLYSAVCFPFNVSFFIHHLSRVLELK